MTLKYCELEVFYEELAEALDMVDKDQRDLFLCKLALTMAREIGDLSKVQKMISSAP